MYGPGSIMPIIFSALCMFVLSACIGGSDIGFIDGVLDGDHPASDGDIDGDDSEAEVETEAEAEVEIEVEVEVEAEEEEPTYILPNEPDKRVVYELHGPTTMNRPEPYNKLPYPYNFFTTKDEKTKTGLRVNLQLKSNPNIDVVNTNMIDSGLYLLKAIRYQDAINTLDGFSTFGAIFFEIFPDLDEAMLPADPEESVLDESLVQLVNLTAGDAEYGERVPIWVEKKEAVKFKSGIVYDPDDPSTYDHRFWYVKIRSVRPLEQRIRYALIVKRGLKTPAGDLLEPSIHFSIVSGMIPNDATLRSFDHLQAERERLAPVISAISEDSIGVSADDLLLVTDFTTQTVRDDLLDIQEQYLAGELADPDTDFDVDDNGEPDLYDMTTYPFYNADTNPDGFPRFSVNMEHVGAILHGTFTATDFRLPYVTDDENRRRSFAYDTDNQLIAQGEQEVPFLLFMPKEAAGQPYPIMLFQHGINSWKESGVGLVHEFCSRGWAVAMMDFPYHGERQTGFAALEFVDIAFPLKARAAFMQSVADHIQFIKIFKDWASEVGDIYPAGGDGKTDIRGEKILFLGQSLGGIVAGATGAVSKQLEATVINVGGGGLIDFVEQFMSDYGLLTIYPIFQLEQFSIIAQNILDAGDGINFADMIVNPPEGYPAKSVMVQESIDDETVPNGFTDNYGRAMRAPHLNPVQREVYGLDVVDGPVQRFGFSQFHPAHHNSLFGGDAKTEMRSQIEHFAETYLETGIGEVVTPQAE